VELGVDLGRLIRGRLTNQARREQYLRDIRKILVPMERRGGILYFLSQPADDGPALEPEEFFRGWPKQTCLAAEGALVDALIDAMSHRPSREAVREVLTLALREHLERN
jgi:hypothetical protein